MPTTGSRRPAAGCPASLDAASLPGVEAVASEFQGQVPVNLNGPQVLFAAVEGENLKDVLAGTPAMPAFPPGSPTPGDGPIPAIVSRRLVDNPRGVQPGGTVPR